MIPLSTTALGMMSGSSLDGLDLAYCKFTLKENRWEYQIIQAETVSFSDYWKEKLAEAPALPSVTLKQLHRSFGQYLGEMAHDFILRHELEPDLIASHGHTVFHAPEKGFSFQLGRGDMIAKVTQIATVSDFRNEDIRHGGQGAPLVPIGDEMLFGDYSACINIGGIANISFKKNDRRVGYDICAANQMLNALSMKLGMVYDEDGIIASKGIVDEELLRQLDGNEYFNRNYPKSLSNQYVQTHFVKTVMEHRGSIPNKLATVAEHISKHIAHSLEGLPPGKMMITGGGAHNRFLINIIRNKTTHHIVVPDAVLVDNKEALIFAFMGVLRLKNKVNCLASVTGARHDSIAGIIDHP